MLVVIIQCGSISQVMPIEVELPAKITWDSRDDWMSMLAHFWRAEGQISSRCRLPDGGEFFSEQGIDNWIHGVLWMRGEAVWT